MRFEILQENLMKALTVVSPAIGGKNDPLSMQGIVLAAEGQDLTVRTTNLAIAIETTVRAKVHQAGKVFVPGRQFMDQVGGVSPILPTEITATPSNVTVAAGAAKTRIPLYDGNNMIDLPKLNTAAACVVNGEEFAQAVKRAAITVLTDKNEIRPALAGIELTLTPSGMTVLAQDTTFASVSTISAQMELGSTDEGFDINIKGSSLLPIATIIAKEGNPEVSIFTTANERHLGFRFGNSTYIAVAQEQKQNVAVARKLYEIRDASPISVECNRRDLLSAMKLARLTNDIVRLQITEGALDMAATGESGAQHNNTLEGCETSGDDLGIAISAPNLVDALSALDCKRVTLRFSAPLAPYTVGDSAREIPWVYSAAPIRAAH